MFLDPAQRAAVQQRIAPYYTLVDIPRCAAEQYPRIMLGVNDITIFERTLAWDHAAGVLLVREAGGRVCDFRGAALGPMHIDAATRQVAAANVRLIEPLQQTIVNTGYAKSFD